MGLFSRKPRLNELSEAELIHLVRKKRSREALNELFRRAHEKFLRAEATRRMFDSDAAKSVWQRTLIRAEEKFDDYDPRRDFTAWLMGIRRKVAQEYVRPDKRHPKVPLKGHTLADDPISGPGPLDPATRTQDPLREIVMDEDLEKVDRAFQSLPSIYRQVILAHYIQEKSYKEIAAELGLSVETVRTRLRRGLGLLRAAMNVPPKK